MVSPLRIFLAIPLLAAGACSTTLPPQTPLLTAVTANAPACSSGSATIAFDFDGASQSHCVIEGERAFTIIVSPEHLPPINNSPWYAFRYEADAGADLTITLRYRDAPHRYPPELRMGGEVRMLETEVGEDGQSASFTLPSGSGVVSAQEIFDSRRHNELLGRLAQAPQAERITLGTSYEGRAVEGLVMGEDSATELIVLLGRAHPPEVSGAVAMEAFLAEIVDLAGTGALDLSRFRVVAVPLLNPDGVARGHWRANLGGLDLNRDWGNFTQPETQAVKRWLDALPDQVNPLVMVDFHSTQRNLFYVQGEEETNAVQEAFLTDWLGNNPEPVPGYGFSIERRNANPGSGTSKNWFFETYDIPAFTYEVGDETDRELTAASARVLAREFVAAISAMRAVERP